MNKKSSLPLPMVYAVVISAFLALTYWGNQATAAVAQMIPMERSHIIVIDAGHGGEDGGAISISGYPESQYNLQIALKLDDLLHLLGYRTIMVRTTDTAIHTQGETIAARKVSDLRQRVKLVNETENSILVSIHQNTFTDSRYSGAQVFYSEKGEGKTLAEAMQASFCSALNPGSNRAAKKADGVYLMKHIDCTGVLVECGFLSNPEEEAVLRSPGYQQKICCVIASALSWFLTK